MEPGLSFVMQALQGAESDNIEAEKNIQERDKIAGEEDEENCEAVVAPLIIRRRRKLVPPSNASDSVNEYSVVGNGKDNVSNYDPYALQSFT